jgi:hypothetical protein
MDPAQAHDSAMKPPAATPELVAVAKMWRRWTAAIAHFACGKTKYDPMEYHVLHVELLAGLRAAGSTNDIIVRDNVHKLEALVRPWFTTRILEKTDPEILSDLLDKCRTLDRDLLGHHRRVTWAALKPVLACLTGAGFVVAIVCIYTAWQPINGWLDDEWRAIQTSIWQTSAIQLISVAGLILIPITLLWINHTRRS